MPVKSFTGIFCGRALWACPSLTPSSFCMLPGKTSLPKNALPDSQRNADRRYGPGSMSHNLVLSLFPGAGLLDRGFEQAGFCVVRGPDTLFGQPIEDFCALALRGPLEGVIGGPPCQDFSRARRRPPTGHGLRMLAQYARVVTEAEPSWFLLENVPGVPDIHISGYQVQRFNLFAHEFGLRQSRNRSPCSHRLSAERNQFSGIAVQSSLGKKA